jgi:cobyrinic acid a,c-diamide synthase
VPIMIAGERSGVGKTTLTLAILAALRQWGHAVQSFKVGPDYIDPMFHAQITGRPCYNLDELLTSAAYIQHSVQHYSQGVNYSLIEGVMGLFDGAGGTQRSSSAAIARLLQIPVVLVIDCAQLSGSVAAIAQGYRMLDPQLNFAGVILNRISNERHQQFLTTALAPLHIPILGMIPRTVEISIPDRHLGLVPAGELASLTQLFERLGQMGTEYLDWPQLLPSPRPGRNYRNPRQPVKAADPARHCPRSRV